MDLASSSSRFSNEEDDEAEASPREIPFMTAAAATTADTGAAASSSSSPSAAAAASGSAAALRSSDGVGGSGTGGGGDDDVEVIEKEHMFDKVLTPSDVGKLNRLVILKQHAEKYFPLDAAANEKGLLLSFEDRAGKRWRFRYSYWNNNQSYVMTKGWSRFIKEKRLDAGDTVSFCHGAGEAVRGRLFIDWKRRPPLPMAPVASPYGALGPWGGGEGRDGSAGGPSWSYRRRHEEIGSSSSSYTISSSSRSGTIVSSNAYTSGASRSCSRFSSNISMEAAALMELELELRLGTPDPDKTDAEFGQAIKKRRKEMEETALKETRMKRIESLVQEFLGGGGGALESWFSELGVGWLLQLDVGASGWTYTSKPNTGIWVRALTQIMETIHLTESFFPSHGHGFVDMPGIGEEEEVDSGKQTSLDPLQFALFIQKAMAKMLIFVDYVFSKSISIQERIEREDTCLVPLNSCLIVNRALSEVLSGSRLQFHSSPPTEVEKIEKEMVSLLSAKQVMAFDAIWSSMEKRRTCVLKSMEDSLGAETPQGSSDIHQATYSVMNHIKFLLYNCWEVDPLFVSKAARLGKYVPQTGLEEAEPFVRMIAEMVFCLGEKLITRSQSFRDKNLGLVFLLNNSNFIREQLQDSMYRIKVDLVAIISSITRNVEHYTESYIQVSWEPMLACLSNPTPLRLVRKYSPLSKFESEFQKIYTTQEFWKVPDPGIRKRLRKAVIEKVIPAYTKHIEDSKVTNLKFTPQELEETLQELFEG